RELILLGDHPLRKDVQKVVGEDVVERRGIALGREPAPLERLYLLNRRPRLRDDPQRERDRGHCLDATPCQPATSTYGGSNSGIPARCPAIQRRMYTVRGSVFPDVSVFGTTSSRACAPRSLK